MKILQSGTGKRFIMEEIYGTLVNCIDGRAQIPAITYLQKQYDLDFVDVITEEAPIQLLSKEQFSFRAAEVIARVRVSRQQHQSNLIAIVAHYDCSCNLCGISGQVEQLFQSMQVLGEEFPQCVIIGLWVDEYGKVMLYESEFKGLSRRKAI